MAELIISDLTLAARTEAARHFGINPKLVTERMTILGWTLAQAVGAEPRPSKDHSKPVEINGIKYKSVNEASKALRIAKTTLARKLKSGDAI